MLCRETWDDPFQGECAKCGGPIIFGDEIARDEDEEVIHPECVTKKGS